MDEGPAVRRCDVRKVPYRDYDYPLICGVSRSGRWPRGAEAFRVEELQLYPFSGTGEHAALVVEKAGITTRDLALAVAERLGIQPSAVGYAGMKDKDAVTVQAFTVTHKDEGRVAEAFTASGAKAVSVSRHGNKLRLGHLAGNRFSIFIEGGDPEAAREAFAVLSERGVPNWFGPQRFGADGTNAADGLLALTSKRRFGGWKRDLVVSALQSLLFNEILARRIEAWNFGVALAGDVMQKLVSGGLFICEEVEAEQGRIEAREICPTGPMFGKKMKTPTGAPGEAEEEALGLFNLTRELFAKETGARRALAFYPEGAGVSRADSGIWLEFACPAGSFATSVVREIAESGVWRK